MRYLFLSCLFLMAVGAAVLAAKDQPTTTPTTQQAAGTPINKFCAVEHDNKIEPNVTTTYDGKTIGFCCKDCIKDFEKDPKKYMASLK